jgi:hypothetical protein
MFAFQLLIGNFGLTVDQSKSQMAVWAVLAAPLLISADLATMKPEFKKILLNKDIIAVNQDKMGKQGLRILKVSVRLEGPMVMKLRFNDTNLILIAY